MSDALARVKTVLQRAVGAVDPRPTLFVVREGAGVEVQIRDHDLQSVVLALTPAGVGEGAVARTEATAVDVIEGALGAAHRPWVDAALAALPDLEAEPKWGRYLERLARRGRRSAR